MNSILLYIKSHFFNSSTAAVELAKKKPSKKNKSFAQNLLSVKIITTNISMKKNTYCCKIQQTKLNKYNALVDDVKKNIGNKPSLGNNEVHTKNQPEPSKDESTLIVPTSINIDNTSISKNNKNSIQSHNEIINISLPKNHNEIDNLMGSCFIFKDLHGLNLKNKDLRDSDFHCSNILYYDYKERTKIDFSNSNLEGVNLTTAFIEGSKFIKSNLKSATITINRADFSGAQLDNTKIKLDIPVKWRKSDFNLLLSDSSNDSTIFDTINTISNTYENIKVDIIKQLIHSFEIQHTDINSNTFPKATLLKNIASENFYLEDNSIRNFAEKLVKSELSEKNNKAILHNYSVEELSAFMKIISLSNDYTIKESLLKNILSKKSDIKNNIAYVFFEDLAKKELTRANNENILHHYSNEALSAFMEIISQSNDYMIDKNSAFIHLMVLCTHNENSDIREKARKLYNTYLNLDIVKSFTEKPEFGNNNKEPDWSEKSNLNYILINKNKTIIIDHDNIYKMLCINDSDVKWNHFYLYHDNICQAIDNIKYDTLFSYDFKIFRNNFRYHVNRASFGNLLTTLNLSDYDDRFKSVLLGGLVPESLKLVGVEEQLKLGEIFENVLFYHNNDTKEVMLKEEHYKNILTAFSLNSEDSIVKSQTLLSLATLFSKYSSSSAFGTESESPQVLRSYAFALMSKANELNPKITNDNFNDWKDKLLGLNNSFSCTKILSSVMMEHAKTHFNEIISAIAPPGWA